MKVRVTEDYEEMSDVAAELALQQIREKPASVLGLTAGSSPLGLYQRLQAAYREGTVDFSRVRIFTLSEYIGLEETDEQSFAYYTRKNFCEGLNLAEENIYMPNGMADDIAQECARYGKAIEAAGGIDMMILGIGPNAHIGFNEPGPVFVPETHVAELSEATRAANARFFDNPADVPYWAVSMGMRDIMFARHGRCAIEQLLALEVFLGDGVGRLALVPDIGHGHHVGLADDANRLARQQFRVARTNAHAV